MVPWPWFHWNCSQNEQQLRSIPHTPRMVAFALGRGTEQLCRVMALSSSEKSHLRFISIIMSLVNNFVRKTYLHPSHLCFHVVSELPPDSSSVVIKAMIQGRSLCSLSSVPPAGSVASAGLGVPEPPGEAPPPRGLRGQQQHLSPLPAVPAGPGCKRLPAEAAGVSGGSQSHWL